MSNLDNRRDLSLVGAFRSEQRPSATSAVSEGTSGFNNPESSDEDERIEVRSDARLRRPSSDQAESILPLEILPQRSQTISWGAIVSFCICVVVPTIAAAIYYIFIASNQYVVQWRFTLRDANSGTSISAGATALTGLLGSGSASSGGSDNYMVTEYITSEQAILDLENRIGLRALYAKPSIDFLSRIDASRPVERFVRYWNRMVSASFDQITGTAVAEVRAFSPEDAYLVATTLMNLTENLVHETSQRPLREAVYYAEAEVERFQQRLKRLRIDLMEYRNKAAVIDPNSSIVLSNATVAATLRQTIAQYQADLSTVLQGGVSQTSSQVETLKRRIKATQDQLKDVESAIAKAGEENQPLSQIVGRYEELDLERQFAQTLLTSAVQALEQARANAMAQRLFVVPYVRPTQPQSSTFPNRPIAIATVAGACMLLWTVGLLLFRAIREHMA